MSAAPAQPKSRTPRRALAAPPVATPGAAPSPVLQAHRERVKTHGQALDDLHRMHEEAHTLWSRIVHLAETGAVDAREELDSLHDQAFALAARIVQVREACFGEVSHETRLRLSGAVESIHPSRLTPEPELLLIR